MAFSCFFGTFDGNGPDGEGEGLGDFDFAWITGFSSSSSDSGSGSILDEPGSVLDEPGTGDKVPEDPGTSVYTFGIIFQSRDSKLKKMIPGMVQN